VALDVTIDTPDADKASALSSDVDFMTNRANASSLTVAAKASKPAQSVTTVVGTLKVYIPLSGLVDLAKLKDQLTKRAATLEKSISGKQGRLGNADYVARAPEQQVAETRALLATEIVELGNIKDTLSDL
jgi:valyl-tRNA synthetase